MKDLKNVSYINIIRIVLIIICMNVKNIPNQILEYVNLFIIRLIIGLTIIYIAYYDPIIAILIAVCFMLIIKQNKLNSTYNESDSNPLEVIRLIDHSNIISPLEKKEYFKDTVSKYHKVDEISKPSCKSISRLDDIVSKYIHNPQEELKTKENPCFKTLTDNLELNSSNL
tara:strand:- start:2436 stop:2945 length:510 start_codon:yes stop_codon:yes gene_type:complete